MGHWVMGHESLGSHKSLGQLGHTYLVFNTLDGQYSGVQDS